VERGRLSVCAQHNTAQRSTDIPPPLTVRSSTFQAGPTASATAMIADRWSDVYTLPHGLDGFVTRMARTLRDGGGAGEGWMADLKSESVGQHAQC